MKNALFLQKKLQVAAFALPPLLRLVQTVVLARIGGPFALGVVFASLLIPNTAPRLLDLGLPHAAGYFLRRDPACRKLLLRVALGSALAGGTISMLVLFCATLFPFSDVRVNVVLTALAPLLAAYIGMQLARDIALAGLIALERTKTYAIAAVLPVLMGPLGLLTVHFLAGEQHPEMLTAIVVLAEISGCLLAVIGLAWKAPSDAAHSPTRVSEILRFGLRAFTGGAAKVLAIRADRILLATLLPPAGYALYTVSLSFRDASLLPGNAVGLALMNVLTQRILKNPRSAWPVVREALWVNFGIVFCVLVGFSVLGPYLVPKLLGEPFRAAVPIMSLIVWSALFVALAGVFWTWFIAAGRPGMMSVCTIIASLATIALVVPLAHWRGIQGAAAGVVAGTFLGFVATVVMALRHLPFRSKPAL
jgi:O-antigen/teichoic acid export membrane protein